MYLIRYSTFALTCVSIAISKSPRLQQAQSCDICALDNTSLLSTSTIPSHLLSKSQTPLSGNISSLVDSAEVTCGKIQSYIDEGDLNVTSSHNCLLIQDWLLYACCDGDSILPLYQCQEIVSRNLFSVSDANPYNAAIPPVMDNLAFIDVYTTFTITNFTISNYGIGGGAIEVRGNINMKWFDPRLRWDANEVGGCTKIQAKASHDSIESNIWVPGRGSNVNKLVTFTSKADITADGNVSWDRLGITVNVPCKTVSKDMTKLCKLSIKNDRGGLFPWNENGINYTTGDIIVDNVFSIPGYELNKSESSISIETEGAESQMIVKLDPIVKDKCLLCSGIENATLRSETIPNFFNDGVVYTVSPNQTNWTCQQIDNYLYSSLDIEDYKCNWAKRRYGHTCCENVPSRNQCEENIRSQIIDNIDTVAPHDPKNESSLIDVIVFLDFTHLLDLDIRSNTLEALVSIELLWVDPKLKWDTFVGGCGVTSFRASLDKEQTEIWVPEIDLLNHVDGAQSIPSSFATVVDTGQVWWKRTGVLKAACDLSGLRWFPFDHPSCNMDFGASRSPYAHRVNYIFNHSAEDFNGPTAGPVVEFSERLKDRTSRYQEYQVVVDKTEISLESETMSFYRNSFVRFRFYFSRSVSYYMWAFIVLYILFTYLSFGMFFLDQRVGERLSFGAGILFVIVAQDITVAERTPITQVRLWIDNISFGSKVFVIFGIVESLVILYYYFIDDVEGRDINSDRNANRDEDENDPETKKLLVDEAESGNKRSTLPMKEGFREEEILCASTSSAGMSDKQEDVPTVDDILHDDSESRQKRDDIDDNDNAHQRQRRSALELGACTSWLVSNILQYDTGPSDSLMKQKVLKLRLWDRGFALLFFFGYSIFLLVMFLVATRQRY